MLEMIRTIVRGHLIIHIAYTVVHSAAILLTTGFGLFISIPFHVWVCLNILKDSKKVEEDNVNTS